MKNSFLRWGIKLARPWFIFGSLKRPVLPYRVNLMFFDEKLGPDKQPNVGDLLSKVISAKSDFKGFNEFLFMTCKKELD